jgi:hypothetical protein
MLKLSSIDKEAIKKLLNLIKKVHLIKKLSLRFDFSKLTPK